MKFFLFCCLFGTFLATGMSLECEFCTGVGQNCSGWKHTCDDKEDTCVTFQTEVIRAPLSITFTSKACGSSDTCHLDYVETNLHDDLKVRSRRTCCMGDECQTPVLEPEVSQKNGLQCPGCIGLSSTECNEQLVSCQGSQRHCLAVTGKNRELLFRNMSFKGCASESLCTLLEKKFWTFLGELEVDMKCTPALPQTSQ